MQVRHLVVVLSLFAAVSANAQESLRDLIARSPLIISGKIVRMQAATNDVPATNSTAIVKVDGVLENRGNLAFVDGREHTLRFQKIPSGADAPLVFFTVPYSIGRSIGADVVAIRQWSEADAIRKEIAQFHQEESDAALRARIRSAIAIGTGRVEKDPFRAPPNPREISTTEHDPDWWIAPVRFDTMLVSNVSSRTPVTLNVAFANNPDPAWEDSPKLHLGDAGVFLLHRVDAKEIAARLNDDRKRVETIETPAVIDRLDFLPLSELPRVRKLLSEMK